MDTVESVEVIQVAEELPIVEVPAQRKPRARKAPPTSSTRKKKASPTSSKPKKAKTEKDAWGLRKGSAKSKAASMYARAKGATLEEVKAAVGSVQLNVLNELEADGHKVVREKQTRKDKRPVIRYKLTAK
jgi:hypothetical protein